MSAEPDPERAGVWIELLCRPEQYSEAQIEAAAMLALALGRGRFVLLERPVNE